MMALRVSNLGLEFTFFRVQKNFFDWFVGSIFGVVERCRWVLHFRLETGHGVIAIDGALAMVRMIGIDNVSADVVLSDTHSCLSCNVRKSQTSPKNFCTNFVIYWCITFRVADSH